MHTMKGKFTKGLMVAVAVAGLGFASTARAEKACEAAIQDIQKTFGFVPQFFSKFPESTLPGAWEEMKTLQLNPTHGAAGEDQGADRPRRRGADPLPLLHLRPHRVRQAERREHGRDRRGGRPWRRSPATGARS